MANGMPNVIATITGPSVFGSMCCVTTRSRVRAQSARRKHVVALGERQHLAAHESRDRRPAHECDGKDDEYPRVR